MTISNTFAPDTTEIYPFLQHDRIRNNELLNADKLFKAEHVPFFTSIFETILNIPDIVDEVHKLRDADPKGVVYSNYSGWQSKPFFELDEAPWMDEICGKVLAIMTFVYKEYKIPLEPQITSFWFNINKKGHFNMPHTHPHNFFGGVIYLKVPSGNCGDLVFERPDGMWQSSIQGSEINDRNRNQFPIEPKKNGFVVFPAHVRHFVYPNETLDEDDERISLAFNFK
jgi:uncharacterized protein (TIGR02466 family)